MLGGAFLGGGGGGDLNLGLKHARLALNLGEVIIKDVGSIPADEYIATVSLVGAPAAKEKYLTPSHLIRSTKLFTDIFRGPVGGLISSENGGYSTVNGWVQSAVLGIPVVDAPADGRAHPTGIMGAMGLHKVPDYISIQTAVGGDRDKGRYVEVIAEGALKAATNVIRAAAVQAGGLVAVTRNPVKPEYVEENAAVGAISQAIGIGNIIRKYRSDVLGMVDRIIGYLGGGEVIGSGEVEEVRLETKGGFDRGKIILKGDMKFLISFWNEFISIKDSEGRKYGVFPDLIVAVDLRTGMPLTSSNIKEGDKVTLVVIPKEHIILGAGVKDSLALREIREMDESI